MKKLMKDQSGLSLIEVLLVTVLLAMVMAALVHLGIMSLTTSDQNRNRGVAVELTKEAIEIARIKRDTNSDDFFESELTAGAVDKDGYYYLPGSDSATDFVFCCDSRPTMPDELFAVSGYPNFYRVVYFQLLDDDVDGEDDTLGMWVETTWRQSRGRTDSASSETILTRWN